MDIFSSDVMDLLDLQGEYGNVESLNYLGTSYLQGTTNIDRDFEKAKEMFLKVLEIDPKDPTANTQLGLIYMLGIMNDFLPEAQTALDYLNNAPKNPSAINAKAVLLWQAPDVFETDPVKLMGWQGLK
jgi:Flp pilus assembly protein TadD